MQRFKKFDLVSPGSIHQVDYIVIGGGRSGAVIANRLSQFPLTQVALIEAGPPDYTKPWAQIPYGRLKTLRNPETSWVLMNHATKELRSRNITQARILGGSGCTAGTNLYRGHSTDYDHWDMPDWKWENLEESYNKAFGEQFGIIKNTKETWKSKFCGQILDALNMGGFNKIDDINNDDTLENKCSFTRQCISEGLRNHSSSAYIHPVAAERKNLKILCDARANKIEMKGDKVIGVTYVSGGSSKYRISVRNQVIVCAGAIGTPYLLQHSGIGNPDDFETFGIPFNHHLPGVGKNLLDQPVLQVIYPTTKRTLNKSFHSMFGFARAMRVLSKKLNGSLSVDEGTIRGVFKSSPELTEPDLGFYFQPFGMEDLTMLPEPGITFNIFVIKSECSGHVMLRTGDFNGAPLIDLNLYPTEIEKNKLLKGVELIDKAMETIDWVEQRSEIDWSSQIFSRHQLRGTCKMGPQKDIMSVVDETCKVYGLKNLRICGSPIVNQNGSYDQSTLSVILAEKLSEIMTRTANLLSAEEKAKVRNLNA